MHSGLQDFAGGPQQHRRPHAGGTRGPRRPRYRRPRAQQDHWQRRRPPRLRRHRTRQDLNTPTSHRTLLL